MDQFGAFLRQYRAEMCGVAYIFLAVVVICHDRFLFSI